MKKYVLLLVMSILLTSACTRQQSASNFATDLNNTVAQQKSDAIAQFVGTSPAGTSSTFVDTAYGSTITVTVGQAYLSGLNIPCKKALVNSSGTVQEISVCNINTTWQMAPEIFER